METSSRNSEVIHAGIYYPATSLKTSLCLHGRSLLYSYAQLRSIPHKKCGKLVLATSASQRAHIQQLSDHIKALQNPYTPDVQVISGQDARALEPDLSTDVQQALWSEDTGIIDSHALMEALEDDLTDGGGDIAYGTKVTRIDWYPDKGGDRDGWVVQLDTGGQKSAILAECVVNAAGLNAHSLLNHILPPGKGRRLYFCKGNYFSYRGKGVGNVKKLLYPCPEPGLAGLGTHLTLSMANEIRFGPDVEWLQGPHNAEPDFWESHLQPSEARLDEVFQAVQKYLPGVSRQGLSPDYVGIRPKLAPSGSQFQDFEIQHVRVDGTRKGFVNLMGIESPGLTSCLSIAEMVRGIVQKQVWEAQ